MIVICKNREPIFKVTYVDSMGVVATGEAFVKEMQGLTIQASVKGEPTLQASIKGDKWSFTGCLSFWWPSSHPSD